MISYVQETQGSGDIDIISEQGMRYVYFEKTANGQKISFICRIGVDTIGP